MKSYKQYMQGGGAAVPLSVQNGGTGTTTTAGLRSSIGLDVANSPTFTNLTLSGDLAVDGADLTSTAGTFNLLGASGILNIGASATSVNIGATTGSTIVRNALSVQGASISTTQTSFDIANTTATTLNIGGAATAVTIGDLAGGGNTYIKTANTTVDGTLQVNGAYIRSNQAEFYIFPNTVTTLGIGILADTISIGKNTGTTTFHNATSISGSAIGTTQTTFSIANTTATTLNIGGAATTLTLGAATGTTTVGNSLAVSGLSISSSQATFTLLSTPTTINFGAAATTLNIGNASGVTNLATNLKVNGATKTAGAFYTGVTDPTNNNRLNYDGHLYATKFYGDVSSAVGAGSTISNTTPATMYMVGANATSGSMATAYIDSADLYYTSATSTLYCTNVNTASDINMKDNVATVENGLDIVKALRGVSFNWKKDGRKSYGVIAQELEQILPDLVATGEDGRKSVQYDALIGILIEAIKELSK